MDPLTVAVAGVVAGVKCGARVAIAHAETKRLRARTQLARASLELTRASANLQPGMEIGGTGRRGESWTIRVPVVPAPAIATVLRADAGEGENA